MPHRTATSSTIYNTALSVVYTSCWHDGVERALFEKLGHPTTVSCTLSLQPLPRTQWYLLVLSCCVSPSRPRPVDTYITRMHKATSCGINTKQGMHAQIVAITDRRPALPSASAILARFQMLQRRRFEHYSNAASILKPLHGASADLLHKTCFKSRFPRGRA